MSQTTAKIIIERSGTFQDRHKEPETLEVPTFHERDLVPACAYVSQHGGHLYSWKTEGSGNWLTLGDARTTDFFCYVVLPEFRGIHVELADDYSEEEETITND